MKPSTPRGSVQMPQWSADPTRVGARKRVLIRSIWILLLLLVAACDSQKDPESDYERPPATGDGWETAYLHDVGVDAAPLLDLLDVISSTDDHLIHGLLIIKDQKLVFEEYWPGMDLDPETLQQIARSFDRNTLHYVASVSKSITSALCGLALDQGLLKTVDDTLFSFFPQYEHLLNDDNRNITLRHLLSFSSGYEWNEFEYDFGDPRDSHYQMFNTIDPMGYLLGRAMISIPGSEFLYNSGDTNLLGEIIRKKSSASTLIDFAKENLFDPLGIEDFSWRRFSMVPELTFASGGASLRPRDMAKIGLLYLNSGVWDGRRILSDDWVDASTTMSTPLTGDYQPLYGYGYNWWLGRFAYGATNVAYYRAAGWGGQDVFVFPELEMVVVFTAGGYYESRPLRANDIIEDYILPALGR
ncbi:MAG: serine hydrolase [Rhodothermales bacterium]|nr:serine hydrolase [Rhodothermales bacterium]